MEDVREVWLYVTVFVACSESLSLGIIYPGYYSIEWEGQGNNVCKVDLYAPHAALFDALNVILAQYEKCSLLSPRRVALHDIILTEGDNTDFQDMRPVNKVMNLIVRRYVDGPEGDVFKKH